MRNKFKQFFFTTITGCLALLLAATIFQGCGDENDTDPDTELAIQNFTPANGPKDTPIIITGTGFSTTATDNVVKFNGVAATNVTLNADGTLTVIVPTKAGTGKISVTVHGQTTESQEAFTYEITTTVTEVQVAGELQNLSAIAVGEGALYAIDGTTLKIIALNNGAVDELANGFTNDNVGQIAVDAELNVYVADSQAGVIKVSPQGEKITITGDWTSPIGLTLDNQNSLYVGDIGTNKIYKVVGNTSGLFSNSGNTNRCLTTDSEDNLYGIWQFGDASVSKIAPNGQELTETFALGMQPWSLASDDADNIYGIDDATKKLCKLTPLAGSDGKGSTKSFLAEGYTFPNSFFGLTIDSFGNIYVTDNSVNKIFKITID